MSIPTKRRVATLFGDGHIRLTEQDVPPLKAGAVLVEVHASLVSPGTELRGGWRSLADLRQRPDPDAEPCPFGYGNAGVVMEVSEGVERLTAGDRVCCIGHGFALHSDYAVVPHHLCVPLGENVTYAQGAYGHLAGTGMHALRRGRPEFGDLVAVAGLGLVGHLTGLLYKLAGCYVIGWDTIDLRVALAKQAGFDEAVNVRREDAVEATKRFTAGAGLDGAVMAFGGDGTAAFNQLVASIKQAPDNPRTGWIVNVGGTEYHYNGDTDNIDIRRSSRPGPGYHDQTWEYGGDYPPVYMRWTTRTNLELCMRLIGEGRLKVEQLTTHTIALSQVDEAISRIIDRPDDILGVVFDCQR